MRLTALLLLCAVAGASGEEVEAPTQWGTKGHLSARVGGGPGSAVQLADYWGTYSVTSAASVTGPGLVCTPSQCTAGTNPSCALVSPQGGLYTNISDAGLAQQISNVQATTCTASTDPRCTTAALTAVFGRFPGVKAVYCTDTYFVMHSSAAPPHPTSLGAILTPPGGGCLANPSCTSNCTVSSNNNANACGYGSQCVTRDYYAGYYVFKWPISYINNLLPTSSGSLNNNGMYGFYDGADGFTTVGNGNQNNLMYYNNLTNLPTRGPAAYTIAGGPWFPNNNNNGGLTWPSCETDMCNAHSGGGFDYHYHGDPFGSNCLYSCANYSTAASHPPLIAYGADGIPVFGRYLSASAPGANVTLDYCGGHTHSGIGDTYITDNSYHYHAFVQTINAGLTSSFTSYSYTAYTNGPYMCFKGNLSTFWNKGFWVGNQTSYGAGNIVQRSDYPFIRPCTGNTNAYVAPGYSINGINGSGFNYSSTWPPAAGPGNTGGACAAIQANTASPPPSPPPSTISPPPPSPPRPTTASPPPSPPRPTTASPPPAATPSPAATSTVAATVSLAGVNTTQFAGAVQTAFINTLAAQLSVSASAVTIVSVTASAGSGRHLLAGSIAVAFSVTAPSASAATVSSQITAITSGAGATTFGAALVTAGVPTTGVTLLVAPTVTANSPAPSTPSSAAAGAPTVKAAAALLVGALALLS